MRCRICLEEMDCIIFENPRCPRYSHKYLAEGEPDGTVSLTVLKCYECGTIQLSDDLPLEDYSSDYQRNVTFSDTARCHAEVMAFKLIRHGPTCFIEIGCGNGLFSSTMTKFDPGLRQTGFEPSRAACEKARKLGLNVLNQFYDNTAPTPDFLYDSFAIRFVLEHVSDPVHVLRKLDSQCTSDAVGLIEVPNADKQIAEGRWFDFFREHTFYYTPATLAYLIYAGGFAIEEMALTEGGEFISAIVRKRLDTKFRMEHHKFHGKTYVWGASGGCAVWLMDTKGVSAVIDSDPNKHGLRMSGSGLKIYPPSYISTHPPDTIIIMAKAYEAEIREQIEALGFKGIVSTVE